jgi:hypothetical protein
MDKNLVGLIAVCLLAGGLYWNWQQATVIAQQQKKIEELEAKTTAAPAAPSIDKQAKCAAQAKKSFDESDWNNKQQLESLGISVSDRGYTNHYNSRLQKCFIEMTVQYNTDPSMLWTNKTLSDAYEGKTYGGYSWHTVEGKKYWEVAPFECAIFPDGTEGSLQPCTSEAQFDALIAKYMGDDH